MRDDARRREFRRAAAAGTQRAADWLRDHVPGRVGRTLAEITANAAATVDARAATVDDPTN